MMRCLLVAAMAVSAVEAFVSTGAGLNLLSSPKARASSPLAIRMGKTAEQKKEVLDFLSGRLETANLMFNTELNAISVKEISELRNGLPEGSQAIVIKNTLLKKAAEGTPWEAAAPLCTKSNLWIVVDEDIKGTITAFKDWAKKGKKEGILGGVLEGNCYDAAGVEAIGKLPSKQDLYAQIAGSIAAVPSKLAGTLQEVPAKSARAIKLAFVPDE